MRESPVAIGITYGQDSAVLNVAMDEAHRVGRSLRLIHVGEDSVVPSALLHEIDQVPRQRLDALHFDYVAVTGDPVAGLVMESLDACALVVGADDLPHTPRLSWPDTAHQVALHATCPVTVVPRGMSPGRRTTGVVVALDGSRPDEGPLVHALQVAAHRHEPLEVVCGAGVTSDYPGRQAVLAAVEDFVDRWRSSFPSVRVHVSVEGGHPVRACLAAGEHASLLVVGRPVGRHPHVGSRSVVSRLVRHSVVPVVVVPSSLADDPGGAPVAVRARR